ncbi:sensor histidine kinase [Sinomonas terrae]|uniref:histidine kinase n=1 Tax=Sinomonas terrae TaxID=2908838 RepID=A0ABS9TY28_9MICC|nr:ATP-binding protein [Sinomonas terrae]MCH6469339.1 ATP-binding protein [Sinomonas terrae]
MSANEQVVVQRAQRYLKRLRSTSRVALWQLPLVAAIVIVAVAAPGPWSSEAARPLILAGFILVCATGAACLTAPWDRLPEQTVLLIPIADLISIGLIRNAGDGTLQGLGTLAIFPVIWIAVSMRSVAWSLVTCFVGPLLISIPTLTEAVRRGIPASASYSLLLPVLMLIVAIAIRAATAGLRVQERLLRSQREQLRALLAESQSTERLLSTILDAVNVGIVAIGPDGLPVRSNRRFKEVLAASGWLPAMSNGQAKLPFLARDKRTPVTRERWPLVRAAAGERIDGEVYWLGSGPDAIAVSVVARPIEGPEGGAVVAFGDVTALAAAADDKAELVRTVAHEFKSPLTAVLGNLDLVLESHQLTPDDRLRLEVAERSAERLLDLAADLVASSSNAIPVRLGFADLRPVLEGRADAARLSAVAAGVQLVVELEDSLWARIDPLRVGQAVDNLLSNAIKYSPDGGTITLRATHSDGWIAIEVRDSGMGISEDERERIFERFFRTSEARRSDIPGVGLGLALCSWIAERHGGRLEVVSDPGCGSVFTLCLPASGPSD